jgi:hypothetical protein
MSDILSILEDFTKAPSEKVPLTPSPYRFAGDNHYWAHVFGHHRHGDFFHSSHVGESNQFEIFLRDRSAQRPKVGGIVVLHVQLAGTAECFGAAHLEFARRTRQARPETERAPYSVDGCHDETQEAHAHFCNFVKDRLIYNHVH